MLLCVAAAAAAYVGMGPAPAIQSRAAVAMAGNKKIYGIDAFDYDTGLFEVREVEISKPPVYLLSRIEELKVATAVSELGVLSALEENGVFSALEKAGAFSTAEKLLPTIESLGLLSLFQDLLEVEAGTTFTIANFLLVTTPALLALQICGFVGIPEGAGVGLEALFGLTLTTAGAVLFVTAFLISILQGDQAR